MVNGPPTNLNSLDARLRNHSEAVGHSFSRARRHVSAVVVAQMLERTGAVVKGGRSLEVRYGLRATRASADLDVVRKQELTDLLDSLDAALEDGWGGFGGSLVDRGQIAAPIADGYVPHRVDVKLVYQGRSFATVQVEIAARRPAAWRPWT